MSKLYLQHDYKVTGRDYVETEGGDTPAGGISYSTEEQDTGLTWTDGKKIYQKTLELENVTVPANGYETIDISALGAAHIITVGGTLATGESLPYLVKNGSDLNMVSVTANSATELFISRSGASLTISASITVTYTKTE